MRLTFGSLDLPVSSQAEINLVSTLSQRFGTLIVSGRLVGSRTECRAWGAKRLYPPTGFLYPQIVYTYPMLCRWMESNPSHCVALQFVVWVDEQRVYHIVGLCSLWYGWMNKEKNVDCKPIARHFEYIRYPISHFDTCFKPARLVILV